MSKREFKLNYTHILFLKKNITSIDLKEKLNEIPSDENTNPSLYDSHIFLSNNELDALLDELTYLFTLKGLQENSEPNQYGLTVEELIDVFTHKP